MDALGRIFGVPKPVIAMLHLPGLPGRPLHDRAAGVAAAVESVARDLDALQAAGVDGVLFCNEADLPYQLRVGHEITAAMASVIGQVRGQLRVPFGVNILWDPIASLAVARATGARFIREVLTGVYESDLGMIEPNIGEIAAYRTRDRRRRHRAVRQHRAGVRVGAWLTGHCGAGQGRRLSCGWTPS